MTIRCVLHTPVRVCHAKKQVGRKSTTHGLQSLCMYVCIQYVYVCVCVRYLLDVNKLVP